MTPVANRTRVVIVQHPRERRHPFGTVRLARLGLQNAEVHVASQARDGRTHCEPRGPAGAALLYPASSEVPATPLTELVEPPPALVVLDGTWPCSRGLLRDNRWLHALPRVALAPTQPGRYRIRRAPRPGIQLSTIEAIVGALRILEPGTPGLLGLLDAFERMIDHQIELTNRHAPPERTAPRSSSASSSA